MTSSYGEPPVEQAAVGRRYDVGAAIAGMVFLAAGGVFLAESLGAIVIRDGVVLPAVVIGLGVALVAGAFRRRES